MLFICQFNEYFYIDGFKINIQKVKFDWMNIGRYIFDPLKTSENKFRIKFEYILNST